MAKCQMCGAEVKIGQYCEYCGSMAEPYYYPIYIRIKEKIIPPKNTSRKNNSALSFSDIHCYQIYIVKRGDCLWNIAKKFYKNGSEYKRIVRANPQITNPHIIYPGQKIKIPK